MWNQLKTIALLGALSALFIGIGAAVAPGHLYVFVALSLLMNLGSYFFSDRIVLAMHRAQPVEREQAPELHAMVEELSARAGIPKPRICIIPDAQPNAFATGRNPKHGVVAVTEGILARLDRRELYGVLAHELGHIKNRDILISSIAATAASAITYVAHALSFASMFGGSRDDEESGSVAGGLVMAIVAPMAATLIQLGISRSREYIADETGASLTGDPEGLARALLKLERSAQQMPAMDAQPATASLFIVNPFGGGLQTMARLFSTHPSTEQRVARLMELAGRTPQTAQRRPAVLQS